MKSEIVLLTPIHEPTMTELDELFTVHRLWEAKDPTGLLKDLRERVRGIATAGHFGCAPAIIDALPKTEIIACFGVGVDGIDLNVAKTRGIAVTNTPDVLTECVADLGMVLLLSIARRIPQADRFVRDGKWLADAYPLCQFVGGKLLGIVGLGRIGMAVAKRAEAFGMKIAYFGPHKKPVPFAHYGDLVKMATDVDFLILTCPGGAETRLLVNAAVLKALGPEGTLVNISRGTVVEQDAMVRMLRDGSLGAAALDVFQGEPQVPQGLVGLDNVVLSPHQGSGTHETRAAMGQLVVDNLKAFFAGQPLLTRVA